jgi:hypothetical protein
VTLPTKLRLGFALLLCAPICIAQSNLGELLDAGGRMLSPDEFKQELVQRLVVGPTPTGGLLRSCTYPAGRYREKDPTRALQAHKGFEMMR